MDEKLAVKLAESEEMKKRRNLFRERRDGKSLRRLGRNF